MIDLAVDRETLQIIQLLNDFLFQFFVGYDFSWYFGQSLGGGTKLNWRDWNENILSREARQDLEMNKSLYLKQGFMSDA